MTGIEKKPCCVGDQYCDLDSSPILDRAAFVAEIAAKVRANCTPSHEAYVRGGDSLIWAVADWIEENLA